MNFSEAELGGLRGQLHRYTEDSIYSVLGVSDGTSRVLAKERFLVDQMWPVSCQTCGVVQLI